MGKVVVFPAPHKPSPRRETPVSPTEMWDSQEPSDAAVWAACAYTRGWDAATRCHGCPQWSEASDGTEVQHLCRAWAAEACRVMLAVQRRESRVQRICQGWVSFCDRMKAALFAFREGWREGWTGSVLAAIEKGDGDEGSDDDMGGPPSSPPSAA